MSAKFEEKERLQEMREKYIRTLAESPNSTEKAKEIADDLLALDLTMYSSQYSFDSALYTAFSASVLDDNISLHPEQLEIINQIIKYEALLVSAPTSFGKTYCIFEYIARTLPENIVLIVPTLALVDEYLKKIIRKYSSTFSEYRVHTNLDNEGLYDWEKRNIFILTHDRVIQEEAFKQFKEIDFLVIDEVYKLETDFKNDRVLVLNMAYHYLSQKSKKYVLLAPFIKKVEDMEKLDKKPFFYNTTYSPVINEVKVVKILNDSDRYKECQRLLRDFSETEKIIVYFPTVVGLYSYVNKHLINEPILDHLDEPIKFFLEWAKEEIHQEWSIIKAMERGYLVHNGQIPIGTRLLQLDYYENSPSYNRLLCTSTLLEGVNTTAQTMIITKPSRNKNTNDSNFSAFDFYNLVGRTGRLNQHFIGTAYYIKSPLDPEYKKIDAIRSIRFELTDESIDIDLQKGTAEDQRVIDFLEELGISAEEYKNKIGMKLRFDTVYDIYHRYLYEREKLLGILGGYLDNPKLGRSYLVKILYSIVEGEENKFTSSIITNLLNRRRPKIKKVVDDVKSFFSSADINYLISHTIYLKTSYIEHQFYSKILLIRYFMELDFTPTDLRKILETKVLEAIEYLYFADGKQSKMLVDIGIYDRDVEKILKIIGDEFEDLFALKNKLKDNISKIEKSKQISIVSKYVIKNLM